MVGLFWTLGAMDLFSLSLLILYQLLLLVIMI